MKEDRLSELALMHIHKHDVSFLGWPIVPLSQMQTEKVGVPPFRPFFNLFRVLLSFHASISLFPDIHFAAFTRNYRKSSDDTILFSCLSQGRL